MALKREYESKFAALDNISVFSLSSEFVYLTTDLSLFAEDYFIKQDIDWNSEDLLNLQKYLLANEIEVVIHKWQPDANILEAITNGGARLVVLTAGDPGVQNDGILSESGYMEVLRSNLSAIYTALAH